MTGVVDLPSNRVGRNIFRSRTSVRALPAAPSEHYDLSVPRTERGDCFAGRGCDFFAGSKTKSDKCYLACEEDRNPQSGGMTPGRASLRLKYPYKKGTQRCIGNIL